MMSLDFGLYTVSCQERFRFDVIAHREKKIQKEMSSKEQDDEVEKKDRVQLSIPDKFLLSLGLQNDHREEETMRRREAKWYKLTGETPGTSIESFTQSFSEKRRKHNKFQVRTIDHGRIGRNL